jgi:hypothetical protein
MSKKIIKVTCQEKKEFFFKKTDVAKKYNYTAQYIGEILNGKTKKNYFVHDNKVYNLEYVTDEDNIQKYYKNIKKEKKNNEDTNTNKKDEDRDKNTNNENNKNIDNKNNSNEQNEKIKNPINYFLKFLNETTDKTEKKEDFVKITLLYEKFQCSDYFLNCGKDVRTNILTLKNMKEYFESNKETVLSFKKNYNKVIDGNKVNAYKVLVGYKFK